jgi:beta-galactosidase/beta-glucuronidase
MEPITQKHIPANQPACSFNRRIILAGIAALILSSLSGRAIGSGWQIKTGGLLTPWAAEVNPTNALPAYPRPQMARPRWLNLNGLWNYAITSSNPGRPTGYNGQILVPYPVESALSGVERSFGKQNTLWYQRTFTLPADWAGQRVLLHFGAVDWAARIFVDGQDVGFHTGGYDPFTFDITPFLTTNAEHDLLVEVTDPTDEGDQPRGKQSLKPGNIFYTCSSGIWQTVWLEPVPQLAISQLKLTPEFDERKLCLQVHLDRAEPDVAVVAEASADGRVIARTNGLTDSNIYLSLPGMHAWSPDDPFLYSLQVRLTRDGQTVDSVSSYFGMRKISLQADANGAKRVALNNHILFQLGALDQGFWPDGIYTAPTDEALASDIRFLKQAGFNLIRKHVKVEPDRWYYWCDKLGILVWQDMPSGDNNTPQSRVEFEAELKRMILDLRNHPCIVQWILFNEGWGQYDTERLAGWVKELDPSRLVDNASGWADHQVEDVVDVHTYPDPEAPFPEKERASVIGEFGGLGLMIPDHTWSSHPWSYEMLPDRKGLEVRYANLLSEIWDQRETRSLSAAVYTQTSDVETECDGLLTFDRAVQKIPADRLADINSGGYRSRKYRPVLSDALVGEPVWQYTLATPPKNWMQPNFVANGWQKGKAGFGTTDTAGAIVRTSWTTSDIWLRRSFQLGAEDLSHALLRVHHDDDVEVYLNGKLAMAARHWLTGYGLFDIHPEALASLKKGTNFVAVHCHQYTGAQYVDVGIVVPE